MVELKLENFPIDHKWSQYELDKAALQVFLLLQRNPSIPKSKVAEDLGYSTTLVNSRLSELKSKGFLRPDRKILVPFLGEREQTSAEAVYNPNLLGLTRMNFFLRGITDIRKWKRLETLLAIHPYTHYHITSFSNNLSLFVQFDIPPSGSQYLMELVQKLQEEKYFDNYFKMEQKVVGRSEIDIDHWQFKSDRWELFKEHEFSERSFKTELDHLWYDFKAHDQDVPILYQQPEMVFQFDKTDLKLLRELTVNSNINISKLSQHYDISRSRISRRIKRLNDLVISRERLVFDESAFNLTVGQIITGTFTPETDLTMRSFHNFLQGGYFPFTTTAIMNETNFIWLAVLPPSYIPQCNRFVWQHANDLQIYQLDITTSRRFYFNHRNLEEKGKWRVSKNYIVDHPLNALDKLDAD